jgi:hypothetical protein
LPRSPNGKDFDGFIREDPERPITQNFFINVFYMPNFTNISGGTVGALNVSGLQTVGSIDIKIGDLLKNPGSQDLANALKALTEAISTSADIRTEPQRIMALQQLDALGQQASVPAAQRNGAIINALVTTVANLCSGAGGLAAVWQTWGPAISKFFGM